jgi:hypothetical protein
MGSDIEDRYVHAALKDYLGELLLPEDFLDVDGGKTGDLPQVSSINDELDSRENRNRRFLLGVLISFVSLAEQLCRQNGVDSINHVLTRFPPKTEVSSGKANSLTLGNPELSLRTYYNAAEKVIRHDLLRSDYPNCAPHATQSWSQYRNTFERICALSSFGRAELMCLLWDRVLDIPIPEAGSGVREIRPFEHTVLNFQKAPGEPGGVVLQALAYAYYRADSPNVTFRPYKVGSGSSRVGAAGDVDGWVGNQLALSIEVKDKHIGEDNLNELDQFILQLRRWPNCTAVVLAESFDNEAVEYFRDHGILCFDRDTMVQNISYWDVPKQKLAVRELYYYFSVIQQNTKLTKRFEEFCKEAGISLD